MKVAIVHYWLLGMRGGEKVVEAIREMYPDADVFTHVHDPARVSAQLRQRVRTTFISKLPRARRFYQWYTPLMPLALEQLDLSGYDLVISSEAGPAKGVIPAPGAVHVCYCHSPMRYIWDMRHEYLRGAGLLKRMAASLAGHYLRMWDVQSAARVDEFAANSQFVRGRIRRYYGRDSVVIHPPVDVERFGRSAEREDFHLLAGQLVQYKRPDIAVDAFVKSGKRLVVIGEGEALGGLRRRAANAPNITFLGWQPDAVLEDHLARCRALVFPGVEDFGILPVEAMAAGTPVIAYRAGGALETIVDGVTGGLFDEQSADSLLAALDAASRRSFDAAAIRAHAEQFSKQRFIAGFGAFIEGALANHAASPRLVPTAADALRVAGA